LKKEKETLTRKEIDFMIRHAKKLRDKAFVAFLYLTGARISEVVRSVKKEDFRKEGDFLLVRIKTLKNRRQPMRILGMPLEDPYTRIVLQYVTKAPDGPLWNFSRQYAWRLLKSLGGEKVHPHIFRHTRLTHCVVYGNMHEFDLMRFAGWSNIKPAYTYVHMSWRDLLGKIKKTSEEIRNPSLP